MQRPVSPYLPLSNGLRPRLLLVFAKHFSTQFQPLSINVLSETLSYLPSAAVLPCISDKSLSLFFLPSGPESVISLVHHFPKFSQCCLLSTSQVLLFPHLSLEVWLFRLPSNRLSAMPRLHTARDWPGIVAYNNHIYLFGGFNECSNERLDDLACWNNISDSQYHHFQLNPCPIQTCIFLCDQRTWGYKVEVYDILSDSFTLQAGVYSQLSGGIMLAEGETLLWVNCQGDVLAKHPEDYGKVREKQGQMHQPSLLCPVIFEGKFYWREIGGKVQSLAINDKAVLNSMLNQY